MSRLIRSPKGRAALYLMFVASVVLGVFLYAEALAAPYVNPFWTNASPSQESALCEVAERAMACESAKCGTGSCGSGCGGCGRCCDFTVDLRTGELFWDKKLFNLPGVVEDNVFAIRWRSMVNGSSQLGSGMLPSWETTAQYVLLIPDYTIVAQEACGTRPARGHHDYAQLEREH